MSNIQLTSVVDSITSNQVGDYIYKSVRGYDLGFYFPYSCIGYRPFALREFITEPAIYANTRIWFQTGAGWDRFSTHWSSNKNQYEGESGGNWELENTFGWQQTYNVRQPPAGDDALVKQYVRVRNDRRRWDLITKVTPLTTSLLNIGYEIRWFVKTEFQAYLNWVYVEREGGVEGYYPINQVKDIASDVSDSVLRFGLVYGTPDGSSMIPPEILFIMDLEQYGWDHKEVETLQVELEGTTYWMLRAGGANLGTPQPVAQEEEVVF